MMMIDEHTTEETHKKSAYTSLMVWGSLTILCRRPPPAPPRPPPGPRWWLKTTWTWIDWGGPESTRRTDTVQIVSSTNFLQSVSGLIWTTHAAVSPELLWSSPSSVFVSGALRTSSVPPDIQPRPRWTAFYPLQRQERRRYWSEVTPEVSKYFFSSSGNILTESETEHTPLKDSVVAEQMTTNLSAVLTFHNILFQHPASQITRQTLLK